MLTTRVSSFTQKHSIWAAASEPALSLSRYRCISLWAERNSRALLRLDTLLSTHTSHGRVPIPWSSIHDRKSKNPSNTATASEDSPLLITDMPLAEHFFTEFERRMCKNKGTTRVAPNYLYINLLTCCILWEFTFSDAESANCLLFMKLTARFQQILKISVQISYYSKFLWSTHFYKYSE